jgi:hypothetical protein
MKEKYVYQRKYQREHREKINAYQRKYRRDHPEKFRQYAISRREKVNAYAREYRKKHPEKFEKVRFNRLKHNLCVICGTPCAVKYCPICREEIKRNWYKTHPEIKDRIIFNNHHSKARRNGFVDTLSQEDLKLIEKMFPECPYCGDNVHNLQQEHIVRGPYVLGNIIRACGSCNGPGGKWKQDILDWYPKQKFYKKERLQKIYEYMKKYENEHNKDIVRRVGEFLFI